MSHTDFVPARSSTTEIAELIGVSRATLDRLAREGGGPPYVRIAGTRRYDPDKAIAWYRAQEHGGQAGGELPGIPAAVLYALAAGWDEQADDGHDPALRILAIAASQLREIIAGGGHG